MKYILGFKIYSLSDISFLAKCRIFFHAVSIYCRSQWYVTEYILASFHYFNCEHVHSEMKNKVHVCIFFYNKILVHRQQVDSFVGWFLQTLLGLFERSHIKYWLKESYFVYFYSMIVCDHYEQIWNDRELHWISTVSGNADSCCWFMLIHADRAAYPDKSYVVVNAFQKFSFMLIYPTGVWLNDLVKKKKKKKSACPEGRAANVSISFMKDVLA